MLCLMADIANFKTSGCDVLSPAPIAVASPHSIQALLREAVRRQRIAQLAVSRQRMADAGIEPMSLEEIQAEVDAHRVERRQATN